MSKFFVLGFVALGACSGKAVDFDVFSDHEHVQLLQHRLQVASKVPTSSKTSATPLPPLGFLKTHKTGSSTVENVVHRLGTSRSLKFVLPADDIHLGWPGEFPGLASAELNDEPAQQYDAICNHAVFNATSMRAYLKPDPFFFSVLRDPITQSSSAFDFFEFAKRFPTWDERLSYLKHLRDKPRPPAEDYKLVIQSEDGTDCVNRAHFQNPQAHDLGWYDYVHDERKFNSDNDKIQAWLDNLDSQIDFVMLTEAFDEGLVLLADKLGLELEDVQYVYMKHGAEHIEPTNAQKTELKQLLNVDVKLYEHFKKAFWKEWEDAGGYQAFSVKLDKLAALNKELGQACSEGNMDVCSLRMVTDSEEFTRYLKHFSGER